MDHSTRMQTNANRFPAHTPESAPDKAAELLGALWGRHEGNVGVMVRTMAGSPSTLAGYLELSRAMKRSKLTRPVAERISLAIQDRLGCEMCLAAHALAAKGVGVTDDEIRAARDGTSTDPAIAAIVDFAVQMHAAPAGIDDDTFDNLRGFGYSDQELLDVVGLVSLNVLTGTFNLVAGLHPIPATTTPTLSRSTS